jgi:hypothetical protein
MGNDAPFAAPRCIGIEGRNPTHQSNLLDGILVGIGNGGSAQKLFNFNTKWGRRDSAPGTIPMP